MKTFLNSSAFALVSFLMLGATLAHADQTYSLGDIDTNDCARAQNEVSILNGASASVSATCEGPGAFASDNGQTYSYRLQTYLTVYGYVYPGEQIQLNDIDTNDCSWAQSEISLLNSDQATQPISAVCSDAGSYASDNGQTYEYRLYTTFTAY